MKKSTYTSYEELPLVLSVPNIAGALGIALSGAYELVQREDFPSFTIGSRILVPKEKFFSGWRREALKSPKDFDSYCRKSVVYIRVAKEVIIKTTGKRRGQHPKACRRPLGGPLHRWRRILHRQVHQQKRVWQKPGRG